MTTTQPNNKETTTMTKTTTPTPAPKRVRRSRKATVTPITPEVLPTFTNLVAPMMDAAPKARHTRKTAAPEVTTSTDESTVALRGKELAKAEKALATYAGTDEARRTSLTDARNGAMVAMRSAGASYSQMAEAMGVVPMTARGRYLKVSK